MALRTKEPLPCTAGPKAEPAQQQPPANALCAVRLVPPRYFCVGAPRISGLVVRDIEGIAFAYRGTAGATGCSR
jgi:hypothetical protein